MQEQNNPQNYSNHFLIAMPNLEDLHFFHSVTFLCEHNEEGAMGFIINRPLEMSVSTLLDHTNIKNNELNLTKEHVFYGGPLQPERGFVIHPSGDKNWKSSLKCEQDIDITTSKDILEDIANGNGPENRIITLGYAAWNAGQLEEEMATNTWLCTPADPQIIFHTDYNNVWEKAAKSIGIDITKISNDIGHA